MWRCAVHVVSVQLYNLLPHIAIGRGNLAGFFDNAAVFDKCLPNFPQLLAYYNAAIQTAPRPVQRLWQDMYFAGTNPTQKQLAKQWGVTEKYVQILNKRLLITILNIDNNV